ncbi:nicotinate (nicotinamide) nucleotide adenylyltransferase [Pseudobutyrivibrio xylanivorans]|uniref:Probable nicotinate-nucleotide adenylyltransferase n=1 Tax=Pseudobutyrivibrio xylanivorans DSM 14809 TaxID=1123012 RepID=A0A1M6J4B2_PSEXY|nr:nicotinate (nicotinamide) nucleotide adenylyltransferase [Pseudobutyrivibrio xylanivorans]SHJ41497.1 nicotinate-nucleotide adenylyltransferase [Pseudobutyrivibrio xylanivorans DSM 14809]
MRIGIYGGTFNPIHNTHIEIAKAALNQYNLDKVYLLVAGTPPHKDTAESVADICRLEMVELAIQNDKELSIDDREIYRSGKSYSYITLTELKNEHPDDDLFFIMGSDSLLNFKNWVKPEIISNAATILVAPRLGDDTELLNKSIEECKTLFEGEFFLIDYAANGIASSKVREDFYKDEKVKDCLKPEVIQYIINHNLYSEHQYSYPDILKLSEEMKIALKPGRYVHTLGVATTAYALALKWNYPAYTAMVAGMLHDCAKCISDEERLDICESNDLPISDIERKYPHLLHGKVGAYFCSSKYDVYDPQIAHAITYHTTGCPNMNLLDKIIFVADYIEPGRDKQPRLDILRSEAYTDLDRCVYMILEDSVAYLNNNPDMVDPTTVDTYNYYKQYMKEKR